jgi:hypothetical protein
MSTLLEKGILLLWDSKFREAAAFFESIQVESGVVANAHHALVLSVIALISEGIGRFRNIYLFERFIISCCRLLLLLLLCARHFL